MDPAYPSREPSVRDTLALPAQYRDAAVKLGATSPNLAHRPVHLWLYIRLNSTWMRSCSQKASTTKRSAAFNTILASGPG